MFAVAVQLCLTPIKISQTENQNVVITMPLEETKVLITVAKIMQVLLRVNAAPMVKVTRIAAVTHSLFLVRAPAAVIITEKQDVIAQAVCRDMSVQ